MAPLRFGPAPVTGTPIGTYGVSRQAASFTFTWSARDGRWLVSMNGTPTLSTDTDRVQAATVVRQQVQITTGRGPVAHTVGSGAAVMLRDGQRLVCTWSRPNAQSPTTFHTVEGLELPLAPGPVWILLTPA